MNTKDGDLLFQTADAQAVFERRKAKQKSKEGDPIELPSSPLDVLIRGEEAFVAENGFVARCIVLASGKTKIVYRGHKGPVSALALYRIDKRLLLITGSWDKSIRVWESTGELLSCVEDAHADFVKSLLVVPELRILISGGSDKDVRIWDLESNPPRSLASLKAHTRPVERMAYHAHGLEIVLWSTDSMGKICIWRLSPSSHDAARVQAEKVCEWRPHETAIYDIVVDVEKQQVWTASADNFAFLSSFDPVKPEREPVVLLRIEHPYFVKTLLPYDDFLLTGSTDEEIRVFDIARLLASVKKADVNKTQATIGWKEAAKSGEKVETGLVRVIDAHAHEVNRLVLWGRLSSSDDIEPWLVSTSLDGTLRRWKLGDLLITSNIIEPADEMEPSTGMTAEEEAELEALMGD